MTFLLTLIFLVSGIAKADPATLSWWLMPEEEESLPHDFEEDDTGAWTELWQRPDLESSGSPTTIMEQGLGVRWLGMNPDKSGVPTRAILILAGRKIVDLSGPGMRLGTVDNDEIKWSDNTSQKIYELKRRRHRRRRSSRKIKFGKITLPPLTNKNYELSAWTVEGLSALLRKLPDGTSSQLTSRDISAVSHLGDPDGSLLNFRYSPRCSFEDRVQIENALAKLEPKLSCWLEQDPSAGLNLLAALQQRPVIDCRPQKSLPSGVCGQATTPITKAFFATGPQINLFIGRCDEELTDTIEHEIFHLAGIKDGSPEVDKAYVETESCHAYSAQSEFTKSEEGYYNELQVETRILLFRKVRDDSVDKWNWSEGEKSFVLGTICAKMGDKFCARRFFQAAAETPLPGTITLPEGNEVSWSSLAQFELYDSITEDIQRMHELVHYLHRDPNGTLLRRLETGVHRVHELYVAREALQAVKNNKGICGGETDEHIMCEDLAQLVKTSWFQRP